MKSETKTCQNCKNQFTIEPEDFKFYEKMTIPSPAECHICIWKNLAAFFVFGKFRKTESALTKKPIITTWPESVRFPIYSREEWVSDAWDSLSYGQKYDPSRSFFEQFAELQMRTPHPHQAGARNVNSEWSDDVWDSKDCYLCRSLLGCENISYGYRTFRCKNSIDLTTCFDTELSYDCSYCFNCYKVKYAFDARNSIESTFLYDCRNVQNCFMCWNLRNKQYHILNKPYSREEYFEKLKEFNTRSYAAIQKLTAEFKDLIAKEAVHRADYNVNTVNSTGNFLDQCKDCFECHLLQKSENCRYILRGINNRDVIYGVATIAEKSALSAVDESVYETVATSHSSNCRYSAYLDYCEECEYCFGCVGLRKKQYCILNTQYSKDDYFKLVAQIKEQMIKRQEWGKFFPYSMAYCGYNLTTANLHFPETREKIVKIGGRWDDAIETTGEGLRTDELSDSIDEVSDEICQRPLICPKTGWKFNIAPHELTFYKEQGIPLPRYHFDYRTLERFKPFTVITSYQDQCFFCGKKISHFYPPEFGHKKIACIECYYNKVV